MRRIVSVVALGLGGLALAVALSLGAFALAGHSLGEPASVLVPITSPSRSASNDHGSQTHTPSASPSPDADHGGSSSGGGSSPTTTPPGGGSSPSPADDHGGGGHGQDD